MNAKVVFLVNGPVKWLCTESSAFWELCTTIALSFKQTSGKGKWKLLKLSNLNI